MRSRASAQASDVVDTSSVDALERSLDVVKVEKVEVPTELLREMLRGQRHLESRCEELDSQLQQLKKVDLERGEGT